MQSDFDDQGLGDAIAELTKRIEKLPKTMHGAFASQVKTLTSIAIKAPEIEAKAKTFLGPPLPQLSNEDVVAIIARGKEHSWSDRDANDKRTPFEWVRDNYSEWIPGLLQNHLLSADRSLYRAFAKRVNREGLPNWVDVPTEDEARLRSISDPQERIKLLIAREMNSARMRLERSFP